MKSEYIHELKDLIARRDKVVMEQQELENKIQEICITITKEKLQKDKEAK